MRDRHRNNLVEEVISLGKLADLSLLVHDSVPFIFSTMANLLRQRNRHERPAEADFPCKRSLPNEHKRSISDPSTPFLRSGLIYQVRHSTSWSGGLGSFLSDIRANPQPEGALDRKRRPCLRPICPWNTGAESSHPLYVKPCHPAIRKHDVRLFFCIASTSPSAVTISPGSGRSDKISTMPQDEREIGMAIHVFSGPTLSSRDVALHLNSANVHAPIKHGDLLRLSLGTGDTVLVIDGMYHNHPPVRHKEILHVISQGAQVIGAASMGALRAAELHPYGMKGIGKVFEMYRDGKIEADDEVAVVHTQGPEWKVLSDALVNIRHALHYCRGTGSITFQQAEELLKLAQEIPYARRSWRGIMHNASRISGELVQAAEIVQHVVSVEPDRTNLKLADAMEAIEFVKTLGSKPAAASLVTSEEWTTGWHNAYLHQWRQHFSGSWVGDDFVSNSDELNYNRIYDEDFPVRWRSHVLSAIAGIDNSSSLSVSQIENAALAKAKELGVECTSLNLSQQSHWLTPAEMKTFGPREAMLSILIRSVRLDVDLVGNSLASQRLLVNRRAVQELIIQSHGVNDTVAGSKFSRHIDHLKPAKLRQHLASTWRLPSEHDDAEMAAAARDRGLASIDRAIESVRPFFLKKHYGRQNKVVQENLGGSR